MQKETKRVGVRKAKQRTAECRRGGWGGGNVGGSRWYPVPGWDEDEEKQIQQVEATAADESGREWPDFYLLISRARHTLRQCVRVCDLTARVSASVTTVCKRRQTECVRNRRWFHDDRILFHSLDRVVLLFRDIPRCFLG